MSVLRMGQTRSSPGGITIVVDKEPEACLLALAQAIRPQVHPLTAPGVMLHQKMNSLDECISKPSTSSVV